jgi:hypothetical protein
MNAEGQTTNHADESMKAEGGGAVVRVQFIASDARYISAIALAVSVICAFYAFETGRQNAQSTYWLQRNEAFLEQLSNQGIKVPCDLRPHNKECKS